MLPPITMSQHSWKGVPTSDPSLRPDQMRAAGTDAGHVIRPEVPTAVDAARRSAGLEKLRDDSGRRASSETPPPDNTPTGPPPTFDETPLQRQARIALAPPKIDVVPADEMVAESDKDDVPDKNVMSSQPQPGPDMARQSSATRGFAEARADFTDAPHPSVDRSA